MNGKIKKLSMVGATTFFLGMLVIIFAGCASNTMAVKETKNDAVQSVESKLITDISFTKDSESDVIWVRGNRLLAYTSVKQPFPLGVSLYFPETALGDINTSYVPDSDIVSSIKASELTAKGHTSRVEILLKKDTSHEVTSEDTDLKISFKKESGVLVSTDSKLEIKEKSDDKAKNVTKQPASSEQGGLRSKTASEEKDIAEFQVNKDKPAWIDRIDFSSEERGESTIIIGTTTPVKHDLKKINNKKLLLRLYNTRLPEYRQRPLITTRFQSAVDRITPVLAPAMKDTSVVTIELREPVPYFVEQTDNLLLLHFEASSISPRPLDKAKLPLWEKVMTQPAGETEVQKADIATPAKSVSGEAAMVDPFSGAMQSLDIYRDETKKKYVGEKIAVDFFKTNIKNVFRIIREVSGENFAIDKDVTGEVTMTLEKPVPWDQVLSLVLKMNQLGRKYEEGIIRVATLKTLANEENARKNKLSAKREIEDQEELITAFMRVSYVDAGDVAKHIINSPRGKVTVDTANSMIVMSDVARAIKRARQIVRELDRVTPQVLIEARIVEASSNFSRNLGVSLTGSVGPSGNSSTRDFSFAATNPPKSSLGNLGINFSKLTGTPMLLNATIAAAESEGQVKIISTPKVLSLNNKTAMIKQGLAYPYNKLDADGNTVTAFQDIALELNVTPHVTPDDRISMNILVKNNEIGAIINNQVSFTTKEAKTELLVNDGDTVIIGGIRKTRKDTGESGIPGLKNIPVLGWLFKSRSKSNDMEELLIFITPRIVRLEQRSLQGDL